MSATVTPTSTQTATPPTDAECRAMWDDMLRAYASVVDEQRTFLLSLDAGLPGADVASSMPELDLPASMPPMPAEMAAWAASLVRETAGLADLARDVLARHPAAPVARRPRAFAEAASGSSMDQKL